MYKSILSLCLLLCIACSTQAQSWDPKVYEIGKRYPGYVIKLNGDTVHGFIEAKSRCNIAGIGYSNQNQCEFYLNQKDRKPTEKYGPKDIRAYMLADKFYVSIPFSGGLVKSNNFCLQVREGRIAEYVWYATKDGYMSMNRGPNESWEDFDKRQYESKNVFQKLKEAPVEMSSFALNYAKKMSAYVSDYPELSKKIADKEKGYRVDSIYKVIEEYNEHFAGKEEE